MRIETESGGHLTIYTDVDRLEAELLRRAPQDAERIQDLTHSIRVLGKFRMLDPSGGLADNWLNMLRDLPVFPLIGKLSKMSGREYGERFSDPLLRSFFASGDIGKMSAVAMVISLAWMHTRNAGYCVGGSQALIRLIEEKIASLGGKIRLEDEGGPHCCGERHSRGGGAGDGRDGAGRLGDFGGGRARDAVRDAGHEVCG